MELVIYDTQSHKIRNADRRTLSVNTNSGVFYLSVGAVISFGLKKGDGIMLASSKDGKSWFLAKTDSDTGFPLRVRGDSHLLCFSSRMVARKISPFSKRSHFLISKEPQVINGVEYYSIIAGRSVTNGCQK